MIFPTKNKRISQKRILEAGIIYSTKIFFRFVLIAVTLILSVFFLDDIENKIHTAIQANETDDTSFNHTEGTLIIERYQETYAKNSDTMFKLVNI